MANQKKRILTSYERLNDELLELFQATYPHGYMQDVLELEKPNGEHIFAVRLETEDCSYLVKVDVTVDEAGEIETEEDDEDSTHDYAGEDSAIEPNESLDESIVDSSSAQEEEEED